MELRRSRLREYLVLHAVGRIDYQTSAEFQTELLSAVAEGGADLILDFSGVDIFQALA